MSATTVKSTVHHCGNSNATITLASVPRSWNGCARRRALPAGQSRSPSKNQTRAGVVPPVWLPRNCRPRCAPGHRATKPALHLGVIALPVLINVRHHAIHAVSVPAIKKERVNSVEDGNTNERGTEKSHLSLPICERKAIDTRQLSGINFQIPSKNSVHSFQNCHGVGRNGVGQPRRPNSSQNKIARQAYAHPSGQVGGPQDGGA
jgi:hypothetical protein